MRYRRVHFAGATYFFTLVTERRRPLFREAATVALFLGALQRVRSRHPFEVDAYVVLPDHLHVLWTLPEGDANFSTRWRLVNEAFTRSYVKTHGAPGRSESRRSKGEQGIWQRRAGNIPSVTRPISPGISTTSTSTRCIMASRQRHAIGHIRVFTNGFSVASMMSHGVRMPCQNCPIGRNDTSRSVS